MRVLNICKAKLIKFNGLDEDTLYAISNYAEPREGKEPGERPAALDTYQKEVCQSSPLNRQPYNAYSPRTP